MSSIRTVHVRPILFEKTYSYGGVDFSLTADKRIKVLCIFFSTIWRALGWSSIFSTRIFCAYLRKKTPMHRYMYIGNRGSPLIFERWCPVVGGTGAVWLLLPSYLQFYSGFYGKTLFSFILFIVARFSKTKIKYFLGEDGYILYKTEWKSANLTLKIFCGMIPLTPSP